MKQDQTHEKTKQKRGFACLSKERRKEIASMGGKRAHELGVAHEYNSETGSIAGRLGGKKSKRKKSNG